MVSKRRIDLLLPPLRPIDNKGGRLPRSPKSQMLPIYEYLDVFSRAFESEKALLDFLEDNYSYTRALLWLRTLQWMGFIDPAEASSPFKRGLKSIEIRFLPLYEVVKKASCFPAVSCFSPFLSMLAPTIFRKVTALALNSKSVSEIAELLIRGNLAAERVIAQQYISFGGVGTTDLIFLLRLLFSTLVVRRGKKSDEGGKVAYIRDQVRGVWKEHPCLQLSPYLGKDLIEAEKFLSGSIIDIREGKIEPRIILSSKLNEDAMKCLLGCLEDLKLSLPEIAKTYEDFWDLRFRRAGISKG
jgi:hypothetical protein